jgi:uncharacterized alkaline shock family protein YloU
LDDNIIKENIPDEIVAVCAMNAALKTEGVFDLASGFTESLSKNILGRESLTKGIKISQGKDGIVVDVHVNVKYNAKIPNVAWDLQENIKRNVEDLTNMPILQVNIHIQGVGFEEAENQKGKA